MSRTPAATLARIKVQHPRYQITRDSDNGEFVAVDRGGGRPLRARSALLLEPMLQRVDDKGRPPGAPSRRR